MIERRGCLSFMPSFVWRWLQRYELKHSSQFGISEAMYIQEHSSYNGGSIYPFINPSSLPKADLTWPPAKN